jgi:hypothetical protein
MKEIINGLKEVLKELLASKKFITLVTGLVVLGCAKLGFQANPDTVTGIITLFTALLIGQGAADFGKAKEEMSNIPKMEILKSALKDTKTTIEEDKKV